MERVGMVMKTAAPRIVKDYESSAISARKQGEGQLTFRILGVAVEVISRSAVWLLLAGP